MLSTRFWRAWQGRRLARGSGPQGLSVRSLLRAWPAVRRRRRAGPRKFSL